MSQSDAIFAAIFLAYVVFITLKGELPTYAGFLLLAPTSGGGGVLPGGTVLGQGGIGHA